MYQKFKRGLLRPSELSLYLKDSWLKVWAYFFLLLILAVLPFVLLALASTGLSDQEKLAIKSQYEQTLQSPHQIVDGELIIDYSQLLEDRYLRLDIYTVGLINTPTSPEFQGMRMIFVKDGIRLTKFMTVTQMYTYEELGLQNFKFSNERSDNVDRLIKAIDQIIIEHNASAKTFQVSVIFMSLCIELLFFTLLTALFSRYPITFKYKFKIAIHVLTVYVVASLFALFFNNGLFIFIGIILMMTYMRRAFSKLTII